MDVIIRVMMYHEYWTCRRLIIQEIRKRYVKLKNTQLEWDLTDDQGYRMSLP